MIPLLEPVAPDDTSQRVRDVMSRPEFSYDKSIVERFGEWISRQLERLFGGAEAGAPTGSFAGGAGTLIAWLIIALAAVAVVATVVYVIVRRVRRPPPEDEPVLATEVEHRHPANHWARLAEEHEARGEWKEALRYRYRELIRTLTDRRSVPDVAGLTTGELRVALHDAAPGADEPFDRATSAFEAAWYAGRATGAAENAAFKDAAAAVLARLDSGVPA